MYLCVDQLVNNETISTTVRIEKTMTARYVRLRLFKYDSPDGTLTIVFKDGATTIGTSSLTLSDLATEVGTFFHGYVRFDLGTAGMRVNLKGTEAYKELNIEISLTSHTDDDTNYISLVKNFEGAFVDNYGTIDPLNTTAEQQTHFKPYGMELFKIS